MKAKWEINKLKNTKQFNKSANLILINRVESLLSFSDKYLKNQTIENLHDVRIALRRLRYSMELFIICYDKNVFLKFYDRIRLLQDLSGDVRDMDISAEKINSIIIDNQIKINLEFFSIANEKKNLLEEKFKLNLLKFILSKILKDFLKQLS